MRKTFDWVPVVLVTLAVAVTAAGCGDDEASSKPAAGKSGTTTVKVGVLPAVTVAPLFVGMDHGIFEKHGLHVTPQIAQGGAAIIPALASGSMQFGVSNTPTTLLAASKGLPLRVVADGSGSGDNPDSDITGVVVSKTSEIRTPADLAGKTVAVNLLNNVGDLSVKASLDKLGVDGASLKFVEIPFPDMPAALAKGRVDAAWVAEPFLTVAKGAGARQILAPLASATPNASVSDWITSSRYAAEHGDVVERFAKAIAESNAYSQEHPEAVRAALTRFAKLPKPLVDKIVLPPWPVEIDRNSYTQLDELSRKYGLYTKQVDVDALIGSN
jgi:NitT/TauT family transport system substrate-binding protein